MTKVFIDGSAGTTGLKIADRLEKRADILLLSADDEQRKNPSVRRELINSADIVFLCLPDMAAIESAGMVENQRTRIIDASTAHRTAPYWSYGFPELSPSHRSAVCSGSRVAVPGCHASGFDAIVYPLTHSGIMKPDYPLSCFSITGYSGGGKKMIAEYESAGRGLALRSPAPYALQQSHKHLPEMVKVCELACAPVFTPIVADFYSGMAVTVPIIPRLLKTPMTAHALRDRYAEYYAGEPLISVPPFCEGGVEGGSMYANAMSGKDSMEIIVAGNDERFTVTARFCNLGKGASGAAIQCFNLMTGCDETTGLII